MIGTRSVMEGNVLEAEWDFGSGAMEARILRPLAWPLSF
jgi:hypothetical protein